MKECTNERKKGFKCSKCKYEIKYIGEKWNFCPKCGRKVNR